jgi:hypothetical protein
MADLFGFEGYGGETPFHLHLAEYRMYQKYPGRKYMDFFVNNE